MTTNDLINHKGEVTRRNFLYITTSVVGVAGVAAAAWPVIDQLNPSDDVLALSSIEVDMSPIPLGHTITVLWRGKPIFIRHRTPEEIAKSVADNTAPMIDPAPDSTRAQKAEWLVQIGICTHLGCVPPDYHGGVPTEVEYNGWLCPCHGSYYDTAGRIRFGPAPRNLDLAPYKYLSDAVVKIG
ncbi:MAG: ubiquinol-cytochrome c reductase iron-sulfur subunit [Alphaproteobacteria bacterium]|nr:ubiquinol-cytochrome c reductase iron-sulfur subunit [Alphaproteobacteria bacterium]